MHKTLYDRGRSGAIIQQKREAAHLTQEKLAERVGCTWRTITDIERGKVGMSIDMLLALCDQLHCTPNEVLLARPPETDTHFARAFAALTPAQQRAIGVVMETYASGGAEHAP